MQKEEIEIISGMLNNDNEAFKRFIGQYQKFVINVCYKFVNNEDDANDIAQEVFIEVFRTINKFRSESKLSTWLYRISVNKSINFLRDNKKHTELERYSVESDMLSKYSSGSDYAADSAYLKKEKKLILDNAIDSLPERQKTVFILNKKEGLGSKEIGEVLGLSVKSVESLIARAKTNLQKILIEYYK